MKVYILEACARRGFVTSADTFEEMKLIYSLVK